MPYHKIPRARLDEDLKSIVREQEVVVSIVANPDDPNFYDVTTRYRGEDELETRDGAA